MVKMTAKTSVGVALGTLKELDECRQMVAGKKPEVYHHRIMSTSQIVHDGHALMVSKANVGCEVLSR